jgi:hypothetical protein
MEGSGIKPQEKSIASALFDNRGMVFPLVLTVIIIILVLLLFHDQREKVSRDKCTTAFGDFGVFHGKTGVPLTLCDGSSNCSYPAKNLSEAVNKCHSLSCKAFSYQTYSQEMVLINPDKTKLTSSTETDVFFSQLTDE